MLVTGKGETLKIVTWIYYAQIREESNGANNNHVEISFHYSFHITDFAMRSKALLLCFLGIKIDSKTSKRMNNYLAHV